MKLMADDVAKLLDLSCVRTNSSELDVNRLIQSAKEYKCGQVSVLQAFIPYVKEQLKDSPDIHLVGNVSFPSGSDSISIKVAQAKEMVAAGCDELDMVMNIGMLVSGRYAEVEDDVKAVVDASDGLPLKVIIETPYLNDKEIIKACQICIRAGATFVKTGTGWTPSATTREHVRLIKSCVGDALKIKASGGIRDLNTLADMYKLGARRFGVNLASGINILDECIRINGIIVDV